MNVYGTKQIRNVVLLGGFSTLAFFRKFKESRI